MNKLLMPLLMILTPVLIVLLQFGFLFLLMGLLPTVVAYFIDHDKGKPLFKTVGACNLAAMLPTLLPMLQAGIRFKHYDHASLISNPNVWLVVYCGAAAGWCIIYLSRFVARFIVTLVYEYSVNSLEHQQKYLLEEWGQEIKHPPM